jgi:hypothetical protein
VTFGQMRHVVPLALIVSVTVMLQTAATTRSFVSPPGQTPRIDLSGYPTFGGGIAAKASFIA